MTSFYLGAHQPHWLAKAGVPLFVSHRRLARYKRMPRALADWALDSGGFSEISLHGCWQTSARDYAAQVRRYRDEVGRMQWAAPQDWMCEPSMLKRTGLTVEQHQQHTLDNFLELSALAPDLPWIPVLQGWTERDYHHHRSMYARAGIDLATRPLVGIGTICRRQHTGMAMATIRAFRREGIRLHGFGVKLNGLAHAAGYLASADSMSWSFHARRERLVIAAHRGKHKACANCIEWALEWRTRVQAMLLEPERQYSLPL